MSLAHLASFILVSAVALPAHDTPRLLPNRVTILYDAFGGRAGLTRDWGFAALVEYNGNRILFDTGNNADVFAKNVRALGIDLKTIDFVVISHRHGDHTAGLNHLLSVNPGVKIYAPREAFGVFGAALPGTFYRTDSILPSRMRYFDGRPPAEFTFGTPWPMAHFVWVDSVTNVAPGVSIIPTVSQKPGTLELRELTLALRTPNGLILLVGCSHPGIETIVEASTRVADHVYLILGGLHLVTTPDPEIARVATALASRRGTAPESPRSRPCSVCLKPSMCTRGLAARSTSPERGRCSVAPNKRLKLAARVDMELDPSSARRSLSAIR
jgi:7,8-dihydropterin-6-yl-methyl-4-(beta-D-ribofuranosyl)aminobenzene 5'-phosphate synthase